MSDSAKLFSLGGRGRRRKSSRHRHRSGHVHHRSPMEKNRIVMRKETLKALAWMLPAIILVIGGVLWATVAIQDDADPLNTQSHKDLETLGRIMALSGGVVFVLAILSNWVVRLAKFFRERRARANDALNIYNKNRRRSRRRHRRNIPGQNPGASKSSRSASRANAANLIRTNAANASANANASGESDNGANANADPATAANPAEE